MLSVRFVFVSLFFSCLFIDFSELVLTVVHTNTAGGQLTNGDLIVCSEFAN